MKAVTFIKNLPSIKVQTFMNGLAIITLLAGTIICMVLAITTTGTVDSADSIYHYFQLNAPPVNFLRLLGYGPSLFTPM